jgi:hypothetical protein
MRPGSRTGLRDGWAVGRVPADPGRSGVGRRTPARNHQVGRGSGRLPDARERHGGAGRRGPGSPGYRSRRLLGPSRLLVLSPSVIPDVRENAPTPAVRRGGRVDAALGACRTDLRIMWRPLLVIRVSQLVSRAAGHR